MARTIPHPPDAAAHARLRAGRELLVVNMSGAGMLVEGTARLLPGTHADLHIMTPEGRRLVRCKVVRTWVCQVARDVVRYRAGLSFADSL